MKPDSYLTKAAADKPDENASPLVAPAVAAWFIGPKAEHGDILQKIFDHILQDYLYWRRNYFPEDPLVITQVRERDYEEWYHRLYAHLESMLGELKTDFPFYSPRYIGHMLSEQTLPSILGYFAGMLFNPNNVTDEAAPVTLRLELEVGRLIAEMLGYNPKTAWTHICSGGTVANLEALWFARSAQFTPLIVREFCVKQGIRFQVKTPAGQSSDIKDLSPTELLGLRSSESSAMLRGLATYLIEDLGRDEKKVLDTLTIAVRQSDFNPAIKGFEVFQKIQLKPVIFVSAAAHYSIKKSANILCYGESAVQAIPVTERFRMNMEALSTAVLDLPSNRYIAAVIGIVGTTEEGAVDPIHEIHFLHRKICREQSRSFWLHVDAAWGGYIRSMFCGHSLPDYAQKTPLGTLCDAYVEAIRAFEDTPMVMSDPNAKRMRVAWADREVYSALLAMRDADSITIDPHKMGYVPYPAGVVAFRNGYVAELMTQKAQYISETKTGITLAGRSASVSGVGPYSLEGSKPGATAAACWLAHTTIPLTYVGHGQIIKASMLSAKKLTRYLRHHKHIFQQLDRESFGDSQCRYPFTFVPLYEPDSNIICFAAIPMCWQNRYASSSRHDSKAYQQPERTSISGTKHSRFRCTTP